MATCEWLLRVKHSDRSKHLRVTVSAIKGGVGRWDALGKTRSMKIQITYEAQIIRRLPPRVLGCAICNFVWAKKRFGGGSWALSECYSGGGGSKPRDESRSAPPDPRDDGFLQKIVDFLGGKIRGKWGRQSEEILHKLEMRR